ALYRTGRQAEALAIYQQTRRKLVEELGIEPGPALQRLEKAVLQQDPELAPPPIDSAPAPAALRAVAESQPTASAEAEPMPPQGPVSFLFAATAEQAPDPAATERKVVSVLFCDLVGFTAASEEADPEDVQARLAPYHQQVRMRIEAF